MVQANRKVQVDCGSACCCLADVSAVDAIGTVWDRVDVGFLGRLCENAPNLPNHCTILAS